MLLQAPPTTVPAESVEIIRPDAAGCDDGGFLCERIYEWTDSQTAADWAAFLLDTPFTILLVVVVAAVVNRIARRLVGRLASHVGSVAQAPSRATGMLLSPAATERARQRAETLSTVLGGVASAVIWTIATFVVLDQLGINLAPLIAGAGIAGIALGFGAQSLVKDVLSGFFMLVEDQYGVGDIVDLDGVGGTVERVTLRVTTLRDINGTLWHVPNGEILRVGNQSQLWSRAVVDVEIAPDADIVAATAIIEQVIGEVWDAAADELGMTEEPVVLGVERTSPTGVTLRVAVKTRPASQWAAQRELRRRILLALAAGDIPLARAGWPGAGGEVIGP